MSRYLQPIKFGSRGFVLHDGSVIGWSLLTGQHNDYHAARGTDDTHFATRWRQWSRDARIDIEERPVDPAWVRAVEAWIEEHYEDEIEMEEVVKRP